MAAPQVTHRELIFSYVPAGDWQSALNVHVSRTATLSASLATVLDPIVNSIDITFKAKSGTSEQTVEHLNRAQAIALNDALERALAATEGQEWN